MIFVGGKSYANGNTFANLDTNDIISWIEKETGLAYGKQFQLKKEKEGELHFQECIDGVAVSPSGYIELHFDDEKKLTFLGLQYWLLLLLGLLLFTNINLFLRNRKVDRLTTEELQGFTKKEYGIGMFGIIMTKIVVSLSIMFVIEAF